jgi:hypothetical protein
MAVAVAHRRAPPASPMISRLLPACLACLAGAATPALAQVYKWVDERGVVSYGDQPPPGARGARPLDLTPGMQSVIPGIPREELDRLRERDTQKRLRQLEAEVEELRAREAARAAVAAVAAPTETVRYVYPGYWNRWPGRPVHPWPPITPPVTPPVAPPVATPLPVVPRPPMLKPPPGTGVPLPRPNPRPPGGIERPEAPKGR